jgi:signal transduction histidine kinase
MLRQKERALEQRNSELVEAGKQKSQFMANITHELRTPIHGICGLSDLVETGVYGPVSAKQKEAHQTIKRSARSLLQLIDDLLELARADVGKLRYVPSEVDLGEVLRAVVSSVRWMQPAGERTVDVEIEDGLPGLLTDRGKLTQIVINLLANAVKFSPDGGRIALRARRAGESVEIAVADEGVGIPEDELQRIFEPFHQVDGSAERQVGGAGLGLAIVRRLADVMGGEVGVTSAPGKGSTFRVLLPLRRELESPAHETEDVGPPPRGGDGSGARAPAPRLS